MFTLRHALEGKWLLEYCRLFLVSSATFCWYFNRTWAHFINPFILPSVQSFNHQLNYSGVCLAAANPSGWKWAFFFLFFFCPPPCVWMDGWMQQVELVLSWPRSITTEGLLLSNKNSTNSWHKSLLKTVLHCQNKSNLYISWARAFYTNKTKS